MLKNGWHKLRSFLVERKRFAGFIILFFLLLAPLEFFIFSSRMSGDDDLYWKSFLANNKVYSTLVPKNLSFAGEQVPTYDFTVIESMERELLVNTYFHSQTILIHKRAYRWLPSIAAILKRNGVPDDFKYITLIESNLTNTISPKGATGFWQFLEGAAKQYGLEVNEEVDERYHVEKATEAACRYFKEAYRVFGSWTLAAASYNVGIDGLKNQLEKQKAASYYDLSLNEETARYIFRILAVKEVISNPKNYGYQLRTKDLYPPIATQKLQLDSSVASLSDLALQNNVSYKILKYFNPWLRKNSLTNKDKKTYTIDLPKAGYNEEYLARLASSDSLGVKSEEPVSAETPSPVFTADSVRKQ